MEKQLTPQEINKIDERFNFILQKIVEGKTKCNVAIPNYKKVKCEITGIDLTNNVWKPFTIHFLEPIYYLEEVEDENGINWGGDQDSPLPTKTVPVLQHWEHVKVNWITNMKK